MRQAIISDIHANIDALEAVLADIDAQKPDEIVCLGDIVGYGANPVECVDAVRERCAWAISGNHDAALFMKVAPGFKPMAATAIAWHRKLLMPQFFLNFAGKARWSWLETLAAIKQTETVMYVHASPRDHLFEYVEEKDIRDAAGPTKKIKEIFEKGLPLIFVGHSHKPGVVCDGEFIWRKPTELTDMTWQADPKVKTLVNIGSVGQPRDKNPDACYVIYDSTAGTITFRRVKYDVEKCRQRFVDHPVLDPRLGERLVTGD